MEIFEYPSSKTNKPMICGVCNKGLLIPFDKQEKQNRIPKNIRIYNGVSAKYLLKN